jgi:hypothetical protein
MFLYRGIEFLKWSEKGALKNKPAQARGDFWAGLFFIYL